MPLALWAVGGFSTITAELPGLQKDEVKVEVNYGALVIQGERKREHKEDHESRQVSIEIRAVAATA
jgi:HSP20 family molecular chaperone IbpA